MRRVTPTIVYNLEAYSAVVETHLQAWERDLHEGLEDAKRSQRDALKACQCLEAFAKIFRVGEARARLQRGRALALLGKPERALRYSRQSLAAALHLPMPYEEALARRQIGRLLPAGDPERAEQLNKAKELFLQLDADYDLKVTQAL